VSKEDMSELESSTYNSAVAKESFDLARSGIGRDIKILWLFAEQDISHSSAHDVGLESCALQSVNDLARVVIDIGFAD
jgi:hypothetical protein